MLKAASIAEGARIKNNWDRVLTRISAAARRAGREPDQVSLVAVAKGVPLTTLSRAARLGITQIGESRVQEAQDKIAHLRQEGVAVTWHMVGHLQRNKVKTALALFDWIDSLDSLRLARELEKRAAEADLSMPVLLEINTSGEESKHGLRLPDFEGRESSMLFPLIGEILDNAHLRVEGLMTMAPAVADPEEARPYFRALRQLRDELARHFPEASWRHLSMGMSDDLEIAVEEGATMVRIGRAIFAQDLPESDGRSGRDDG
ncbi:MAG: YggS family pyridoxal phosphate-dependent enzyme [Anaerolineae bacterium]